MYVCVCLCVYSMAYIVCLSAVAQWANVLYLRVCVVLFLIHTHTHKVAGRGASALVVSVSLVNMLCSGFPTRCGYKTSSRFLCLSLLPSPLTSSLSLCLLRESERHRERERKASASNLKVLPGCPPLGPNSPLCRGRPPSASLRKTQIKFINKTVCLWLAGELWFVCLHPSCALVC